ncbi:MAG: Phosphodiesterase/alkaline phosphatase D [uncultured Nocardioidaceae bacterium]|uniref:Phosphodiesterase/alkaline phosphatase D n=1 Tax=uncultured Nocardioidaceae bacterium TaxID=253824 RepID=A0A6J4N947_9ACTN|nr:MAG: Phosphodiesterase/alkaline phosphatase D [uncultured Nocardioidaceae bacterium]
MGDQFATSSVNVSRRDVLRYSLSAGAVVWAGSLAPGGLGMSAAEAQELFRADRVVPERFPQSVASGDPRPHGIVLWTRVDPLQDGPVKVAYEVARASDTRFRDPVLRGVAQTSAKRDYTLKVQLDRQELQPFQQYRYRFIINGAYSRPGKFKTLPAPHADISSVRFGYISCQDYTNGYYNALGYLAEEDIDYVVHLGDYIYETVPPKEGSNSFQGGGPPERYFQFPKDRSGDDGLEATTLRDYRFAYKKYRSDRKLQRMHESFAVISIWDDHEFVNDCYRTHPSDQASPPAQPRRRAQANQAWAEYTPAGVTYEPGVQDPLEEIRIYRSFAFGNLMELVMTDERLYRDPHPCGEETVDKYLTPGCDAVDAPGRTMLGDRQLDYFLGKINGSHRRWKVWGNETMVMQLKLANTFLGAGENSIFPELPQSDRGDGVYFTLDQWDGYQAERRKITRRIRECGTENFVIITGDIHTFVAGYVKENYDLPLNEPPNAVGTAFVVGSVTSSNLFELALGAGNGGVGDNSRYPALTQEALSALQTAINKPSNPHFEFIDSSTHGYNLLEVTKESLTCTMKAVSTIQQPEADLYTLARFRVPAGKVEIIRTDSPVPAPSTVGSSR